MPGEYTIVVEVETAFEDGKCHFNEVNTVAQYSMRLKAEGEPRASDGSAGGCAASASTGGGAFALLAGVFDSASS